MSYFTTGDLPLLRRRARGDLPLDQIGTTFRMECGVNGLADAERTTDPVHARIDAVQAFRLRETLMLALEGQLQKAAVFELTKHGVVLLTARFFSVSQENLNKLMWQNNGGRCRA